MLTGVTDEIPLFDPVIQDLIPFHARGKSRAATATEPGSLEFLYHLLRREFFHAFLPGFITPDLDVGINVPGEPLELLNEAGFGQRLHNTCSSTPNHEKGEWLLYGSPCP